MIEKYLVLAEAKYQTEPEKDPIFGEKMTEADDLLFKNKFSNESMKEKREVAAQVLNFAPRLKGVSDIVRFF